MKEKATVLDALSLERCLVRLAHEIVERNAPLNQLVLLGIKERGDLLARRLSEKVRQAQGVELPVGELDISRYRDDLRGSPEARVRKAPSPMPFEIEGKVVILVDDVICTGRSVRAALDALIDYGRPSKIQLAVLIDRGHREFPIRPDFVGKNIPTSASEIVQVHLHERDGEDRVVLLVAA